MLLRLERFSRPATLEEARARLEEGSGVRVLGGGTRLLARRDDTTRELVDVTGIGLDEIKLDGPTPRLGATVRLQDLVDHPGAASYYDGELARAAKASNPSRLKRNRATVAGEVLSAGPLGVLSAAVLALDGTLHVDGVGEIPQGEIYERGVPGIVTGITLEADGPGRRMACEWVAAVPTSNPMALSAVWLEVVDGRIAQARVVVGSVGDVPVRLPGVEGVLASREIEADGLTEAAECASEEISLTDCPAFSADYLRRLVAVCVRRGLFRAAGMESQ